MNQPSKDRSTSKAKPNWLADLVGRVLMSRITFWMVVSVVGIVLMVAGLSQKYRPGQLPDGRVTADGLLIAGALLLVGAGIIRALRKE